MFYRYVNVIIIIIIIITTSELNAVGATQVSTCIQGGGILWQPPPQAAQRVKTKDTTTQWRCFNFVSNRSIRGRGSRTARRLVSLDTSEQQILDDVVVAISGGSSADGVVR